MLIEAGTQIGAYEVIAHLGAGGMGEVYRARDRKLGRDVALKILPEAMSHDAQLMARFEREARTLASLNHPNIAAIYGLEESNGIRALVLELVEGPMLAERISVAANDIHRKSSATAESHPKSRLQLEEVLPVARQIAEALEYAHEKGIIHRDLKPANVMITPGGAVKVLDFGLAKVLTPEDSTAASDPNNTQMPTTMATQAGMILGTAAYMSPEQAKGRLVDRRADIWAFGCILFEMLSGRKAFEGETTTDVLAAVIRAEPDWTAIQDTAPPSILKLARRCLEKDPKQRLRDIGDARIAIDEAVSGAAEWATTAALNATQAPAAKSLMRRATPWSIAVLVILAAALIVEHFRAPNAPGPVMRFILAPTADGRILTRLGAGAVLSPDASRMAYVLWNGKSSRLYVRALDQDHDAPVLGTDGAGDPFFSPDGEWVGFFADGKLKKVAVGGGAPVTICDAPDARGAVWGRDNTILFAPTPYSPLERVSADGGGTQSVTKLSLSPESDIRSHRWPDLLPDGKHALFNVVHRNGNPIDHSDICVVSLATGTFQVLIRGGSYPHYMPDSFIVYVDGTDLLAARFDASSLSAGPPMTIMKGLMTEPYSGGAQFSFSNNGTLLYLPSPNQAPPQTRLVWVDRKGRAQTVTSNLRAYSFPRLLPGGKKIVVEVEGLGAGIWLYDTTRDALGPLDLAASDRAPVLTPDGTGVIYNTIGAGSEGLVRRRVDGSGGLSQLTKGSELVLPSSVSPDGKLVAYSKVTSAQSILIVVPLEGDHVPRSLFPGPGNRGAAAFSPDGRWIAYVSDESGESEVYVQASTGQGGRWQVSSDGGTEPLWAHSGRELFYRAGKKMMAATVVTAPAFSAAKPRTLFEGDFMRWSGSAAVAPPNYDVSPDDQQFVMVQSAGPVTTTEDNPGLRVVLNWTALLGRK